MAIINILIGIALLFFGRKVFWLFVAGIGFMVGMSLAANTFNGPDWLNLTIGLVVGFIAALLAVFVQHFAIGFAAFLAGGYVALQVLPMLNLEGNGIPWLAFVAGGILGIILVGAVLDWALIILSSLTGSTLILNTINLRDLTAVLVFILLVAFGISYQTREFRKDKRKSS